MKLQNVLGKTKSFSTIENKYVEILIKIVIRSPETPS